MLKTKDQGMENGVSGVRVWRAVLAVEPAVLEGVDVGLDGDGGHFDGRGGLEGRKPGGA